ncbi:MAG TPA: TPM domain-containing protein [Myxococcales bacterium]|nr:TPM domain-containing protein [Myxococcales bacterium]
MKLRLLLVGLLAAPAVLALVPDKELPVFTGYVVDKAGILGEGAAEQIRATASRLDHAGVAQIAVCTVPDLGDWSVEEFAVDLFRKWGLGHGKKRADGLLLLLVPGKPGHRKIKVEVGYGLEGLLPDGKVGALIDQYAVPALRRNDYGDAALKLVDAMAGVVESNAGAGGELAPGPGAMRGGRGVGAARGGAGVGGLGAAILSMGALLVALVTSGARRQFPGKKTGLVAALLTAAAIVALIGLGGGAGWIALLVGLVVNGFAYASIRSHKCPRDGSWMEIDQQVVDEPTYWSRGLAHVVERCTNSKCGYRREYDKELPRKQRTVYIGGGGGGGWGGGGGDGFSGGGGGDSGGGGASREV